MKHTQTTTSLYYYRYSWIQLLRPMTLSGTVSPICVGSLVILWHVGAIQLMPFLLLLISSICVQMATNIWNDYFDFQKGQDKNKWQHQASNKSHPAHDQLPIIAITLTVIAIILGMWLAMITTFWILPIGILGLVGGFYYSAGNPSLSQVGLGEVTAAVFLGFATVILPFFVQDMFVLPDMILIAVPFALLISTMILTNNIRDIDKDQDFRTTLPILLKRRRAIGLLKILLLLIYVWTFVLIGLTILPLPAITIIIGLPFAFRLTQCFTKEATDPACMKYAAWHHWAFGLSLMGGVSYSHPYLKRTGSVNNSKINRTLIT